MAAHMVEKCFRKEGSASVVGGGRGEKTELPRGTIREQGDDHETTSDWFWLSVFVARHVVEEEEHKSQVLAGMNRAKQTSDMCAAVMVGVD